MRGLREISANVSLAATGIHAHSYVVDNALLPQLRKESRKAAESGQQLEGVSDGTMAAHVLQSILHVHHGGNDQRLYWQYSYVVALSLTTRTDRINNDFLDCVDV